MYLAFLKETKKSKKSRRRGSREQREKDRAEVNSSEFKTSIIFKSIDFLLSRYSLNSPTVHIRREESLQSSLSRLQLSKFVLSNF